MVYELFECASYAIKRTFSAAFWDVLMSPLTEQVGMGPSPTFFRIAY